MNGKIAVFITGTIVFIGLMMFYQSRNSTPAVDYWERVQVIREADEATGSVVPVPDETASTQRRWVGMEFIDLVGPTVSLRVIGEPSLEHAELVGADWDAEMRRQGRNPEVMVLVAFYPDGTEAPDWNDGWTIEADFIAQFFRPHGAETFMTAEELADWTRPEVPELGGEVESEPASTMPRQVGMEFYESQGWVIVRAIGEPSKHYATVVSAAWEHEMEQARRDPRVTLFVVFYPPGAEADDWSDGTTIHAESIGSYIRPYGADTFMTEAELEEWQNQQVEDLLPTSARQPEEGSTARTGYARFQQRLGAGADCPELFDIRNEVRRADQSSAGRMDEDLRAIGCYSSASSRTS